MFYCRTHFFKRRPRREYLYDEYSPKKSVFARWLKWLFITIIFILGLFILFSINFAQAADFELVNKDQISTGSLLIKPSTASTSSQYSQLPLLQTEIEIEISGLISRAHVKQHFKNTSQNWIEGIYVFPLPENAKVDHMRLHIGERVIEGQIKEKQQAKRIYNKAKNEGKKSALIEQERPNLFTTSVANIAPDETVIVELEYQQVLHYNTGDFSLRLPTAITPRYIPALPVTESFTLTESQWLNTQNKIIDASRITPPFNTRTNNINPLSISINLDAGFPVQKLFSRYHAINQVTLPDNHIQINLSSNTITSDRDFELVWTPETGHEPKAALFNQKIQGSFYQMLMVLPASNGANNGQPLAREVTYVIDTSGSMHGTSIQQAKRSLLMALERLRLHDRFNIIQFNSSTDSLFSNSKLASFENILLAKNYIHKLQANGGTEMLSALKLALKQATDDQAIHQIIFLTDGSVSNESALFNTIHNKLGNSRLFTIAIGSAPNSYFMRKAAQFGRGTFTYISDVNEVKEKMNTLFSKLESPVMTDIHIQLDHNIKAEIWPERIPDLYLGEPLILAIKTDKPLQQIKLNGTRALAPWHANLSVKHNQNSKGIGTFWAGKKISSLMDSLHEGTDEKIIKEKVLDIALTHHLVSKYTSLVAVDITPARLTENTLIKHKLPVNLPHVQSHEKIFGRLPQTATPATLQIYLGIIFLLSAFLFRSLYRKNNNEKSPLYR